MKKRLSTAGISCVLLAAFIGSVEANIITTINETGTGLLQLATESDSIFFQGGKTAEWAVDEKDDSIKWLLPLYRVDDASDFIAWNTSSTSTDETLPTGEELERDFSLGGGSLFGYNIGGLAYGDLQTTAATTAKEQPSSTSPGAIGGDSTIPTPGSPLEKIPVSSYATSPLTYLDPPTGVYTDETPRAQRKDPKPEKARVTSYATIPLTYLDQPIIVYTAYTAEPPRAQKKDPKPQAANPAAEVIPPKVVILRENPTFAGSSPSPEYPESHLPNLGPNGVGFPDDITIHSPVPVPVPEPATMLLFSTGIAGISFSRLRRNNSTSKG